ncbi:MAG TPA: ATP-binding protein [Kofleriaceae bacterium]|nr:ATP-binding protein [Kofleriaceae bacterium]
MQHLRADRAGRWPVRRLPQLHGGGAGPAALGMDPREVLGLLDALTEARQREHVARSLAVAFGVEAVLVFVPDPGRRSKLIPAPGFAMPPAMHGWRELLARCVRPEVEQGVVAFPDRTSERPACAYAFDGIVFVLVGMASPRAEVRAALAMMARIVATILGSETALSVAAGELAIERQNAERAAALTRALDGARADAERATRVKDEFLAMLGHELRNPLAPIVTALQMLRMEGVSSRAQDVLERQVAHVLRLVDDLLDVSRITSGKIELRKEPVELSSVVTRALEMTRPLLERRRNRLTVDVPDHGLVIDGDPARLAQIVSNLVTNAAKYSDPDSAISVRAARDGYSVRLVVVDEGIGIDAAYLDRVFDQFVQVPQGIDRSAGGLGLGLAIVRSLVERHGGTVRAASRGRGHGSTFIVELPLSSAVVGDSPAPPAPAKASKPTAVARLLVVDDNVDAAMLLAEVLATFGHEVRVAHSGPDALAELASFRPDAALLDIGLPVMDGYELAQHLRARLPGVKLIALTGYGQTNDRERSRAAGFDAHLVKPVSIANVTRTLDELLIDQFTSHHLQT